MLKSDRALKQAPPLFLVMVSVLVLGLGGVASARPSGKVGICHKTGSAGNPYVYSNVSSNAVRAHREHGDTIGVTSKADCPRPVDTTLSIDKSGPIGAFPGQELAFTVTVTNEGARTARGVTVVDTLPSVGTFVSSTPAGTPASPGPGAVFTVALGDIGAGGSASVTIRWLAPSSGEGSITNTAMASASNASEVGPATARVGFGVATSCDRCGVTAGGTGLRNRSQGNIEITGIPAGATVGRAVLVWAVLHDGTAPPSTITFQGRPVAADFSATTSEDLCWLDNGTVGYASDVTEYVTSNGSFTVTDPPRGTTRVDDEPAGALPYTNGASLFVYYTGAGTSDQVISDFSYDTSKEYDSSGQRQPGFSVADHEEPPPDPGDRRIDRSFTGIDSVGGSAGLIMAGPDGQVPYGETVTFTGSGSFVLQNTWDGSDPQDGPSFAVGNLWDTDVYDVSSVLPAGQSTLTVALEAGTDCIGVSAAVLRVSRATSP